MITEVYENIYQIQVPLPHNPLRHLNSYFIRGIESDLLIDTGFRLPECEEALKNGLIELNSDPTRRDVLITHFHSDHAGMADIFVGPGRKIYTHGLDYDYNEDVFMNPERSIKGDMIIQGYPMEVVDMIPDAPVDTMSNFSKIPEMITRIYEGHIIDLGNYKLKLLSFPGHTPGNTMFYIEDQKIMFTGDNILFDVTPNITIWSGMTDSLGTYLSGLERAKEYDVELALPGHRMTGDYYARIDDLIEHHKNRISDTYSAVRDEPMISAYKIASKMKWNIKAKSFQNFGLVQQYFAIGETLSHLEYLIVRNKIESEIIDGVCYYKCCD